MMKKIIAGIAAAALAVSAMATAAFAATETKTIDVDLYNGTGATMTTASYTATATVKLPAALTAVTGSTITSTVIAGDPVGPATLTEVKILGKVSDHGVVTASVLGTEADEFAKGTFTEVTVAYTFNKTGAATTELTADELTAVNAALKTAKIALNTTWKAGDEEIGAAWTSDAIGDTTAVSAFVKANAEAPVNKTFKLKAAEKAALLEAGAAKVVLTIVSESDFAASVEQTATIGAATVKVKPAAATKTLTFETDLAALYSEEYGEWETLSVSAPACLTAKLVISYEAEVEETEDTSADETDVTEDTTAPEEGDADTGAFEAEFGAQFDKETTDEWPSFADQKVSFDYGEEVTLTIDMGKKVKFGGNYAALNTNVPYVEGMVADFVSISFDGVAAEMGAAYLNDEGTDGGLRLTICTLWNDKITEQPLDLSTVGEFQVMEIKFKVEEPAPEAEDTSAEGDTGDDAGEGEDGENGKGDNTETGVVLAVVPAIVAGAALVVSRKRK